MSKNLEEWRVEREQDHVISDWVKNTLRSRQQGWRWLEHPRHPSESGPTSSSWKVNNNPVLETAIELPGKDFIITFASLYEGIASHAVRSVASTKVLSDPIN